MRAISDVVQVMVEGVREGKVINLNAVKNEAARRYGEGEGGHHAPHHLYHVYRFMTLQSSEHDGSGMKQEITIRVMRMTSEEWRVNAGTKAPAERPAAIPEAGGAHQRRARRTPRRPAAPASRQTRPHGVGHRRRRRHVQAPSLPAHRHHGKHLRVLPRRTGGAVRVEFDRTRTLRGTWFQKQSKGANGQNI